MQDAPDFPLGGKVPEGPDEGADERGVTFLWGRTWCAHGPMGSPCEPSEAGRWGHRPLRITQTM